MQDGEMDGDLMDIKPINFKTVDQTDQPASLFQDNVTRAFAQISVEQKKIPITVNTIVHSANAVWTKPENLVAVKVTVIGGGGGGGGSAATGVGEGANAANGGGGGTSIKTILAKDLGRTVSVTVGAGGTAAAAGNNAGGTGGTSSFGTHCQATGGTGGGGGANTTGNAASSGGNGGIGTSGDINFSGTGGTNGRVLAGSVLAVGLSGSSFFGGGIRPGATSAGTQPDPYGVGGTGATASASTAARAGGAGSVGIVYVEEFLQGE